MNSNDSKVPGHTVAAIVLLLICVAIDAVLIAKDGARRSLWPAVGATVVPVLLCVALWMRQNWARYVLLVLLLIGVPMFLFNLKFITLFLGKKAVVVSCMHIALRVIALGLLFLSRQSRDWFLRSDGSTTASTPTRRSQMMSGPG